MEKFFILCMVVRLTTLLFNDAVQDCLFNLGFMREVK